MMISSITKLHGFVVDPLVCCIVLGDLHEDGLYMYISWRDWT